ncbi:T9SS type A sorting domain-containing protein [Sediminibacterium soli]|uniref:T9SS type A sorting domain-containing protein n=1 Tax=Sediminibacterium soli TaxID=2698829 RepID=UPI00374386DD
MYYSIAPNPIQSSFTVNIRSIRNNKIPPGRRPKDLSIRRIQVFDNMGNLVLERTGMGITKQMSVTNINLKSGLYTVKIFGKDVQESHSIIVRP